MLIKTQKDVGLGLVWPGCCYHIILGIGDLTLDDGTEL